MRSPFKVPPARVLAALLRILLCVWTGASLQAQPFAFRHFDYRDGLPHSQVQALLEDRDGFLWIGTLDGVARLSASGVRTYGPSQGLRARNVAPGGLFQDREGALWVVSQESGVARIRGSRVENFGALEGLDPQETYSIAEDTSGILYMGTRLGLFRFQAGRFQRVDLPGIWKESPIYALAPDPRGGLWLGSRQGRLAHWDGAGALRPSPLPKPFAADPVYQLRTSPRGELWALFLRGLLRLAPRGEWVQVPLEGFRGTPKLQGFQFNAAGDLAIALGSDGVYLARRGAPPRILDYRSGISRDAIRSVLLDSRGILWTGSDGNYLSALMLRGLRVISRDPETGAEYGLGAVTGMLETEPGRMLLCSSAGLHQWEEGRGITRRWTMAQGLPSNDLWAVERDGRGGYWIGTVKGLARLQDGRILPGHPELETATIGTIVKQGERIWVGADVGLCEFRLDGTLVARHTPPPEIGQPSVFTLLPTDQGLLAGTRLGVYLFRDGRFEKPEGMGPVAGAWISALHVDPRGRLWVGTLSGLYGRPLADPTAPWMRVGQAEGLPHESINWIQTLSTGTVAVGTGKGVSLWREGVLRHLTRNMGLLSDETNQDGVRLDRAGRLWIGMIGGVCVLERDGDVPIIQLPAPRVLEATWSSGSAWLPKALDLPRRPGTLMLHFDVGLPSAPLPCRFEVRMEGLDPDWRPLERTDTNTLQIADLPAGSYTFRVRATQDGLSWVTSEPFPITVAPSWYQRFWAQALLVLAALGLLGLLVHWRTRTLRNRAEALEARIQERTEAVEARNRSLERLHTQLKRTLESRIQIMNTVAHDLRSPLTSILISLDRLRDAKEPCEVLPKCLGVMEREAKRLEAILTSLLNQARSESMVDSLNLRLCRPAEILHGLMDTLRLKAEARDLSADFAIDPRGREVWLLADMTGLQQVLYNLLENALKFTPAGGSIGVRTRVCDAQTWSLEVWDTGRGVEPAKREAIFQPFQQAEDADTGTGWGLGLSICRAIVEAHEGRIELDSEVGKGSTFRVFLPLVQPQRPA